MKWVTSELFMSTVVDVWQTASDPFLTQAAKCVVRLQQKTKFYFCLMQHLVYKEGLTQIKYHIQDYNQMTCLSQFTRDDPVGNSEHLVYLGKQLSSGRKMRILLTKRIVHVYFRIASLLSRSVSDM